LQQEVEAEQNEENSENSLSWVGCAYVGIYQLQGSRNHYQHFQIWLANTPSMKTRSKIESSWTKQKEACEAQDHQQQLLDGRSGLNSKADAWKGTWRKLQPLF
jgi:hypothetical protein